MQEELSMKEKALRETQIRNIHEMGEEKRAQELRVEEFFASKLRESQETTRRLTSEMQEMQEQTNSMNDSGEFQEVESIFSGNISHVPSQPAVVPSPRSLLSCDKRLPLDTWNTSGPQENVFGSQCSTIDSSRNHYGKIHDSTTPGATASVPVHIGTKTPVARDQDRINDTIPMPTFARRPSTMSSSILVDIPQNSMAVQQRLQISELQFDNFSIPSSFFMLEDKIQKPKVTSCSDFPSKAMSWITVRFKIDIQSVVAQLCGKSHV